MKVKRLIDTPEKGWFTFNSLTVYQFCIFPNVCNWQRYIVERWQKPDQSTTPISNTFTILSCVDWQSHVIRHKSDDHSPKGDPRGKRQKDSYIIKGFSETSQRWYCFSGIICLANIHRYWHLTAIYHYRMFSRPITCKTNYYWYGSFQGNPLFMVLFIHVFIVIQWWYASWLVRWLY